MSVLSEPLANSSDSDGDFPPFVAPVSGSRTTHQAATVGAAESRELVRQLGVWRLEREVGRGGMGVVYEAFDTVLGRSVALKLLPSMAAMEPKKLARFEHEAQVVARLSHPHIVPLYSIGCEQELHFLVMRLIDGVSLDRVAVSSTAPLSGGSPDGTRILATQAGDASSGGQANGVASAPRYGSESTRGLTPPRSLDDSVADQWLQRKLFGESAASCRYIATLGWQAAEALSYAHSMGVIHRDVKPSNLVVDRDDNLWITDFGLAQIQGEHGLTMTGDLLGTLRYMSPEQGMAQRIPVDHRTDVYSLGATLYELFARRPAFEAEDRKELLRQVLFDDPVPLRKHDPHIPWPLQVIVEKAMQKDQRQRYATARALADDLRRWLDGEPILARPPTLLERASHWASRRKGAVATGLVSLFVLLATLAIFGQRHASELSNELAKIEAARADAVRGQLEALLLQAQMGRATDRPGRRLQSLDAVTRAAELARKLTVSEADRVRLRSETIAALGVPFDVEPLGSIDLDFPNRVCMFDPAFRQIARVTNDDGTLTVSKVDAAVLASRVASAPGQNEAPSSPGANALRLAKMQDGVRLPGFGIVPAFWQFSLDGSRLIAEYWQPGGMIVVWNLETAQRVYEVQLPAGHTWASTTTIGERTLAVVDAAGELRLFDLVELRETSRSPFGNPPTAIALVNDLIGRRSRETSVRSHSRPRVGADRDDSPRSGERGYDVKSDQYLVVGRSAPDRVEVLDVGTLEIKQTITAPGALTLLLRSWSGGLVGTCRMASGYAFWDLVNSQPFGNVERPAYMLDVSPQGDLIAFADQSEDTELRDARTGQRGLRLNGRLIGFDETGELLALQTTYRVSLYRVHRSEQVRRLRPPGQTVAGGIYNVSFSGDSQLMAVSSPGGARLYDVASGRLFDTISNLAATNVAFLVSGTALAAGQSGMPTPAASAVPLTDDLLVSGVGVPLQRWRKVGDHWEHFVRQYAVADPIRPTSFNGNGFLSVSRDGQVVARCQFSDEAIVWRDESKFTRLGPHPGMSRIAVSPDGKTCVSGTHNGVDLFLWDTASGERLRNVWPGVSAASPVFSADGRWLLASSGREFRLFETADWKTVWQHAREDGSDAPAPIAFRPDRPQFAIGHNQSTMRLYSIDVSKPETGLQGQGKVSLYAELPLPEPCYSGSATFSPDGRWLSRNTDTAVFVWDLQAISEELRKRDVE